MAGDTGIVSMGDMGSTGSTVGMGDTGGMREDIIGEKIRRIRKSER